jgi:hypothetical protein
MYGLGREYGMKLRFIAFKWHVEAPLEAVATVLKQVKLTPGKKQRWTRSIGTHSLTVEARVNMCSPERSYFWIRFANEHGPTDKELLARVLSDWYFTMSQHFVTTVNWMQVALDIEQFRPIYGFVESNPRIWSKAEKQLYFSFYPILDHYYFEVRNEDIRNSIPHQRFSHWLDELKHNLKGQQKPDDQISFDLVV